MANARNILVPRLGLYKLCRYCTIRHGSRQKPEAPCYICKGLLLEKDKIVSRIVKAAKGFQYETFLVGAVLPTQIYEREDALRARLKIKGVESVKSQLTRELGLKFSTVTGKQVDYFNPDLVINLTIDKQNNVEVSVRSKPVVFFGRYTKKLPGLGQKQDRCARCDGRGCDDCGQSGLSGNDSIEGVLAKALMQRTGGKTPRFSWIGSEDRSSLVLGNGRPFYARVYDPRKRRFRKISIKSGSIGATVTPANDAAFQQSGFVVKTKIVVKCDAAVKNAALSSMRNFGNSDVKFESRSRFATKRIYSAVPKRIDENSFSLTIVADGGLMIKQFVGGEEYMKPNISEVVGSKCDCVTFDILEVNIQKEQGQSAV